MDTILDVKDLTTSFRTRKKVVRAVNGISFSLGKGEMLGVVGESGCGKSVSMLSIIDLLPPAATIDQGKVFLEGIDLRGQGSRYIKKIRGNKIGMIFQDPMTSLNPVMKIGNQMAEAVIYHQKISRKDAFGKCSELLKLVGISNPRERLNEFPHQLSGGMRQRVMVAMALTCDPEILIADEPTTALDVTIQAQIVELIRVIRDKLDMSIILITHDLGLIAGMVNRVIVMYAGNIVEEAPVDEIYENPRHPYTKGLLNSIPKIRGGYARRLPSIEGSPPDLTELPPGCPYMPRCPYAIEKCAISKPALTPINDSATGTEHHIACWIDVINGGER